MTGFGQKLDFFDISNTTELENTTKEFRTSVSRNVAVYLVFLGTLSLDQGNVAKWGHIEITFKRFT